MKKPTIDRRFWLTTTLCAALLAVPPLAVQARDRQKDAICREHGFELIRVENSYARRYNYIKSILINYFRKVS